MKSRVTAIALGVLLMGASVGVTVESQERAPKEKSLQTSYEEMSLQLFRTIYLKAEPENTALSPAGVCITMNLLLSGARGKTKDEIASFLKLQESPETNSIFIKNQVQLLGRPIDGAQAIIKTTLNYPELLKPVPSLQRYAKENFGVRFVPAPMELHKKSTSVAPAYKFKALQTVDFKGTWLYPFTAQADNKKYFYQSNGKKTLTKFMERFENYFYYEDSLIQVVRIPYGLDTVSLWLVLPREKTGLKKLVEGMTVEQLEGWKGQVARRDGSIEMPLVSFEDKVDITHTLQEAGVKTAFERGQADFTSLWETNAFLDTVYVKSTVAIREKETEAHSEVGVEGGVEGGIEGGVVEGPSPPPPPPPFSLIADHPFFFAIIDNLSALPIMFGVVEKPS